ncbi:MAG: glycosyltransferase [Deltaproteobacteria bacterium]|nr:glycosyltransferase [Deltaproteobacteria bacterium]
MDAEGKLKILFLSHSSGLDGAEKCLLTLVKHLDRQRFVPFVILPSEGPFKKNLDEMGVNNYILPISWWIHSPACAGKTCEEGLKERSLRVARLIEEEGIDIVHTNTSVIAEGAIAARMTGRPHVWHLHEILQANPSLRPIFPPSLLNKFFDFLSDSVVVVSEALRKTVNDFIDNDKISVIYNGIELHGDVPQKTLRKELCLPEEALLVCNIGHISKEKGQSTLIDAAIKIFNKRKDVWFLSVGNTGNAEIMSILQDRIKKASIENYFKFLGLRKDIYRILKESDIYVVSSETESFSLAALEAMAAGKPIVATKCGGPEELVIDGETGFLVPVNDADEMSNAIMNLIQNDALRLRMGFKGKEYYEKNFTVERYVESFEKLYTGLSARKSINQNKEKLLESMIHIVVNMEKIIENQMKTRDSYIEALLNSYSWKITAPLRKVLGFIK